MLNLTGSLEQQIMDILWEVKLPVRAADVLEKLNSGLAYTTVMTVLHRLYKKGILGRNQDKNAFVYYTLKSKEDFANDKLTNVFENILSSYGNLAISQFVETVKKDKKLEDTLKKFLNEN